MTDYRSFYGKGYFGKGRKSQWTRVPDESEYRDWTDVLAALVDGAYRPKDPPMLILGCGLGHDVALLRERGIRAVGVDVSDEARQKCNPKARRFLVQADLRCLPFKNKVFSRAVSNDVLEHLHANHDLSQALCEIRRVARRWFHKISCSIGRDYGNCGEGGLAIKGMDQGHVSMFSPRWWRDRLRREGPADHNSTASIKTCSFGRRQFGDLFVAGPRFYGARNWVRARKQQTASNLRKKKER